MLSKARFVAVGCCGVLVLTACTSTPEPSLASGERENAGASTEPSQLPAPVVMVQDFSVTFAIEGVTAVSDGAPLTPPLNLVWETSPYDGTDVQQGDPIGFAVLADEVEQDLGGRLEGDRIAAQQLEQLTANQGPIAAPLTGRVTYGAGDWFIESPGIDVVVDISPIQALRLRYEDLAGEATVETVVGQRTVSCESLWFEDATDLDAGITEVALHCRLPNTVETVAGLRSRLSVSTPVIPDATVVPNIMIGTDSSGYVVTIVEGGDERTIPVDVGPSNGVVRVILSELPDGAELVLPEALAP